MPTEKQKKLEEELLLCGGDISLNKNTLCPLRVIFDVGYLNFQLQCLLNSGQCWLCNVHTLDRKSPLYTPYSILRVKGM